jgi:hypothetical protein
VHGPDGSVAMPPSEAPASQRQDGESAYSAEAVQGRAMEEGERTDVVREMRGGRGRSN